MQLSRPRFTLRRLMIAVALSPIVILAGKWASETFGYTHYFIESFYMRGSIRKNSLPARITRYSYWPGCIAIAVSSLILVIAWVCIEKAIEPRKRNKGCDSAGSE
jgi:hypothetical protein